MANVFKKGQEGTGQLTSIHSRMLVTFILLVLLPTAAVSLTSVYMGYRNGKEQVYNQLESVVALKRAELLTWTESLHTELFPVMTGTESYRWVQRLIRHHFNEKPTQQQVFTPKQAYLLLRDSFLRVTESSRNPYPEC